MTVPGKWTEAQLLALSMEMLVARYNELGPVTPAGPKTFSTRAKAVARILALQAQKDSKEGDMRDPIHVIRSLLSKTQLNGCTAAEEASAVAKAFSLITKNHLSTKAFLWPLGYDPETGELFAPIAQPEITITPVRTTTRTAQSRMVDTSSTAPPTTKTTTRTIRSVSEALLLEVVSHDEAGHPIGLSYNSVLEKVQEQMPGCKTTYACLRWYAVHMRERGERVPMRPRDTKKVSASG